MERRALRIGLVLRGFGAATGPASYAEMLKQALPLRHEVCLLSGAGPAEVDVVHVVDAKRFSWQKAGFFRRAVILDYHDDYWVEGPRYPAPDRALRVMRNWQLRRRHLAALRQVRHVIVHSQAAAESFARAMERWDFPGAERPAVHVVPYALWEDEGQAASGAPTVSGGEKILLLVGRDIYRKGFTTILGALPRVRAVHPHVRLVVMAGEYPHTRLLARFQARGLPVKFYPAQSRAELAEWFRRGAALVLPSWQEAFGIVLLEAMAAGVPVIASRTGGIPEVVEDGVSGLLVPPGDSAALAAKLIAVLSDDSLRARLIASGRRRAEDFSLARMTGVLEEVYYQAWKGKR